MAEHWNEPLTRALLTRSDPPVCLATLHDAAHFVMDRFSTSSHNAVLEQALECLIQAAETGTAEDRSAATIQVELLLRLRGWL
jgi:hypothetical protein